MAISALAASIVARREVPVLEATVGTLLVEVVAPAVEVGAAAWRKSNVALTNRSCELLQLIVLRVVVYRTLRMIRALFWSVICCS